MQKGNEQNMKNYRACLTGAFGCPIDENPGVVMMNAAYQAAGLNYRYINFLVQDGCLKDALNGIRAMNFEGVNLTVPHKVEALQYVDELSESVQLIGATNTIVNKNGKLVAYNTDGQGFVEGMAKNNISLQGKRLVILGAGGASRAIAAECALAGAAAITIINRNEERGLSIVEMVSKNTACRCEYRKWTGKIPIPDCDILINATTIGLFPDESMPDIDYSTIRPSMIVQDIIPNPAKTPFLKKAASLGAATYDGLSMLVYQGAIAFQLWTGVTPDTQAMIDALAAEQSNG